MVLSCSPCLALITFPTVLIMLILLRLTLRLLIAVIILPGNHIGELAHPFIALLVVCACTEDSSLLFLTIPVGLLFKAPPIPIPPLPPEAFVDEANFDITNTIDYIIGAYLNCKALEIDTIQL